MRAAFVIGLILGCGRGEQPGTEAASRATAVTGGSAADTSAASSWGARADAAPSRCTALPFAKSTPLSEASGAAWMEIGGRLQLVVIGDSGNSGAYAVIDPESGETHEQGQLDLGSIQGKRHGDDLEGVASRDGNLVAISSPGWIRIWQRAGRGFRLLDGPYPLGDVDLPDEPGGIGDVPPGGDGMVCPEHRANCGRNYEGLCLAPRGQTSRCVGFAAAKADGHLYCLVEHAGKLRVERAGAIAVARPGLLSDCAFSAEGSLYVGSNLFEAGRVVRVDGWQDPATAKLTEVASLGSGFPETIAARGDVIYRMSDTGGSPSLMQRYRCK